MPWNQSSLYKIVWGREDLGICPPHLFFTSICFNFVLCIFFASKNYCTKFIASQYTFILPKYSIYHFKILAYTIGK